MCGIAGIISSNPDRIQPETLRQMNRALAHRGPDGEGIWMNEARSIGMAHRRLAIIDLSEAAAQPMHYLDRYTISYNGEIYNYLEIRAELSKQGYSFSSASDTEVILAAYDCYREKCLNLFDGMFAFAIWDEKEKNLFAARDRFGEKPFYYYHADDHFLFASEMKGLWSAGAPRDIDQKMMLNFVTLGYVQNPADKSQTFFKNIYALPPAHFLQLHLPADSFHIAAYFDIDKQNQPRIDEAVAREELMAQLTNSIRFRLRSDVPLGASLSGGIDSSSIAAIAGKMAVKNKGSFKTFSAVFPGFEKDESPYIKQVCDRFNLENFTVTPTHQELLNDLEKLSFYQEEPITSSSVYLQYRIMQLAKDHGVKVLLDGQGADETLAGYHKYLHWYLQEILSRHRFAKFRSEKRAFVKNHIHVKWDPRNVIAAFLPSHVAIALEKAEYKRIIHHPHINKDLILHAKGREWEGVHKPIITKLNDILYFNTMRNGLEELLRFADRNAMSHGREVRLPFLQHRMVSFIFSLPSSLKINNGYTKWLLRKGMEGRLPESIVWRTDKVGYEPPQKNWMETPGMQDYIHAAKEKLVHHQILKPSVLNKKVKPLEVHQPDNFDWRYLSAGMLYENGPAK